MNTKLHLPLAWLEAMLCGLAPGFFRHFVIHGDCTTLLRTGGPDDNDIVARRRGRSDGGGLVQRLGQPARDRTRHRPSAEYATLDGRRMNSVAISAPARRLRPIGFVSDGLGALNWTKVFLPLALLVAVPVAAATGAENTESVNVLVITILVLAFTVAPAIIVCWWYWDSMKVEVVSGVNDDSTAASTFIKILERAQETLVIYDDGNKMEGTIYDDPNVIKSFRDCLTRNKSLIVSCLFNDKDNLDLVQIMRAEHPDRFKVWYRRGNRPPNDVHYKIADGGIVGHISAHAHGQPERRFKLLDCSAAKGRAKRIVFRKYLSSFEADIAAAT